jgi:hypothetical protein
VNRALILTFALAANAAIVSAAETPVATTTPAAIPANIVIYEQENFKGRTLTLGTATPDLAPHGFDNKVASLTINGGGEWVLCENRNYAGRCVRVQDKADDLRVLQLWGRVSSLYPVPKAAAPAPATP